MDESAKAETPIESDEEGVASIPDFIFPANSAIWRVAREHVLLLGGPAAAILQIAHPEVAAGVSNHSDFRRDAMGRLNRTLEAVYTITFGQRQEVERMAAHVRRIHSAVKGNSPTPYTAFSQDAQMWVLATLMQLSVEIYERFAGALGLEERNEYFSQMRVFGRFFGLEPGFGPQNWPDFEEYYRAELADPVMASLPVSRELARHIAYPRRPPYMVIGWPVSGFFATEFLPSPLAEKLGFSRNGAVNFGSRCLNAVMPALLRVAPGSFRYCQQYLRALKRLECTSSPTNRIQKA